jgi:hypothetical protein
MSKKNLGWLVLLASGVGYYFYKQSKDFINNLHIYPKSIHVDTSNLLNPTIELEMFVGNNSPLTVTLQRITGNLTFQDRIIGKIDETYNQNFLAMDSTILTVNIKVDSVQLLLSLLIPGETSTLNFKGFAVVSGFTLPIDQDIALETI